MAKQDQPVPVLAKLNLAMAPALTPQAGSPYSSTTATIAAGAGVDVADVLWALVEVRPSGGNVQPRIKGRTLYADGTLGAYVDVGGTAGLDIDGRGYSQLVNCAPYGELAVDLVGGSATSVIVNINPCVGGAA